VSNNKNRAEMAWNDNNNQTPPELDEVIKDFKNKFNSTFGGKTPGNSGQVKQLKVALNIYLSLLLLFG
jgi:hypothetical protein